MMKTKTGSNVAWRSLGILIFLVIAFFLIIYYKCFQVDYHELGGHYMSVSASTIKFVNQWLKEGAANLHFTCYEGFDSIEFKTLEDRWPYLSYPTGSTFIIWILAKITGRTHIGVSFLKHVQAPMFMFETLFFAILLYLFLSEIKLKRERDKILVALLGALSWLYLPGNAWYLANVLYADQIVIMYIMMFILLEYIYEISASNKVNMVVRGLKICVIYIGVLTDYYFWIFIFLIFLFKVIKNVLLKKSVQKIVIETLEYVCPVLLGVVTFVWQISHTQGWIELLTRKLRYRTNGEVPGGLTLFKNFCAVYGYDNSVRGGEYYYLLRLCLAQQH